MSTTTTATADAVPGTHHLPDDVHEAMDRARRWAWTAIAFQLSAVVLVFLAMGSSAAMKAAWIEDTIGLIPPIAFLVSLRRRRGGPSRDFPWGHARAATVAFLVSAAALAFFGIYIVYDSLHHLASFEHTTIGTMVVFGEQVWAGWPMVTVMAYTIVPAVLIGRRIESVASDIEDKSLHAEGSMLRADWMTAAGTIVGVLLVGAGFWWADGVVAALIGVDVVKDGWTNLKGAVTDLEDQRPRTVDDRRWSDLDEQVAEAVRRLPWVEDVAVRLREQGQAVAGELWVRTDDGALTPRRAREATAVARDADWRLQDLVVVPFDHEDVERLPFRAPADA